MKKRTLFACGLAAALFAGCSSDDVTVDNGNDALNGKKAYVALNIQLPTSSNAPNSRADQFHPGADNEYNVNSLLVVYFDTSDKVKFVKPHTQFNWAPTSETGVTTETILPVQTDEVDATVKEVLVVVNPTANFQTVAVPDATKEAIEAAISSTKAADFIGGAAKDNFFMTNAPLLDGTTYVKVTPQETEAAAKADARTVYVERAVAKVQVDVEVTPTNGWKKTAWPIEIEKYDYTYTIPGTSADPLSVKGDEITLLNWTLDVTNTKTYPIRRINTDWGTTNDYITATEIGDGTNRYLSNATYMGNKYYESPSVKTKRVYWAIDPNYDNTNTINVNTDFTTLKDAADTTKIDNEFCTLTQDYCLENTFNVTHMKQNQTTRVLIQARYTPHKFVNYDGTDNTSYTKGDNWYRLGNSSKPYHKETLLEIAKKVTNNNNLTINESAFKAGQHDFSEDMFDNEASGDIDKLKSALGQVTTFVNGICYYEARIQHFGNVSTAWNGTDDYTTGTADMIKNYLGRYGVVRNTWYQLVINTISAAGNPLIPTPGTTADDVKNYYLQTTVKIMDWAVRNQSVDL
ncbi:MAG: Mfa1 family fimbria major subunit [Bacteroidales bacterium]|nr:Mfa1 family fimbria major subunit [Bacteroidales bacterium]